MTHHYPDDAAIERLATCFLDRTLPKAEWTHAGHFATALWLLRRRPDIDAPTQMPAMIRAYNEAVGGENTDTAGYHETITQASLAAARRVLVAHPPERPLHEVVDALMACELGKPDWLLAHWRAETLFSVEARRHWVAPDLQPLPQ